MIIAFNYKGEILQFFEINIASDREYINPKHICSRCYRKIQNSKRSNTKSSKTMVKTNLFWVRHEEQCIVCDASQNQSKGC